MGIAAGAVLAGAVIVTVLTRTPHVPPPTATQPSSAIISGTSAPIHLHRDPRLDRADRLISPIDFRALFIGVVALIVQRRMLWVLVAQVVLVAFMVDDFYWHKLAKLWRLIYPWAEQDRILGDQYWLIPLVLGAGFLAIISVMRSLSRTRQLQIGATVAAVVVAGDCVVAHHSLGHLWILSHRPVRGLHLSARPLRSIDGIAAVDPGDGDRRAAAVLVAWVLFAVRAEHSRPFAARFRVWGRGHRVEPRVLALGVIAVRLCGGRRVIELGVYRHAVATRSLVTPADLTVLQTLTDISPSTTVVMTNSGNDAGMWMAGLTDLTPMVPNGFEYGALSLPLDSAVSKACTDPAAAVAARATRGRASSSWRPHHPVPMYPWKFSCIAELPNLRLITSAPWEGSTAAAFA